MSSGYQRRMTAVFNVDVDRTQLSKLLYAVAAIQVAALAYLSHLLYPLGYLDTGLLGMYEYWLLLGSLIVSSALLAYYGSAFSGFVATVLFYLTLNMNQLLYFSVVGGDTTGEISELVVFSRFTHIDPGLSVNYTFGLTLLRLFELDGAVTTVNVGYHVYFLLLTVAVWLFAYRLGNGFFAYLTATAYLVVALVPLNNQFVPQMLAFVFLVFLFYAIDRSGRRWRVFEFGLFLALSLSHPVFPLFYPLALMVRPTVTTLVDSYADDESFTTAYEVLLHPITLTRRLLAPSTWLPDDRGTYLRIGGLWVVYFLGTRPTDLYALLVGPRVETTGNPLADIAAALLSVGGSGGGGTERQLLYTLVPQSVDAAVTWGSRLLVVGMLTLLTVSLLYNELDSRVLGEYRLELLVVCVALFVVGWGIESTYSTRVLQVAFLPAALFFYGLKRYRKQVVVLVVVLALFSPVLLANNHVNNTITAGGSTVGYHETHAGQTIDAHYRDADAVVVPPHTPYPVGPRDAHRAADIQFILDGRMAIPDSGLLIHSERLDDYIQYRNRDCTVRSGGNVVYDNTVQVHWQSGDRPLLDCRSA
jgi:hypothetical protein